MTQDEERALACEYGAERCADRHRGDGWCYFRLKGRVIWYGSYRWVSGQIIAGRYVNHQRFDSLKEAFDNAAS